MSSVNSLSNSINFQLDAFFNADQTVIQKAKIPASQEADQKEKISSTCRTALTQTSAEKDGDFEIRLTVKGKSPEMAAKMLELFHKQITLPAKTTETTDGEKKEKQCLQLAFKDSSFSDAWMELIGTAYEIDSRKGKKIELPETAKRHMETEDLSKLVAVKLPDYDKSTRDYKNAYSKLYQTAEYKVKGSLSGCGYYATGLKLYESGFEGFYLAIIERESMKTGLDGTKAKSEYSPARAYVRIESFNNLFKDVPVKKVN
jgi:hypothetical protein